MDTENVKADYRSGVLMATLPKKEVAKPKTHQDRRRRE
jgi:HSP20 family molecular chaperone IbpA